MAWYEQAVFYHIYPLGLTGAPKQNDYGQPVSRLNTLLPWIDHIRALGCNALYIGPLFQSVGHGYETTDYKLLDSRLGTNADLKNFVAECHKKGIRVIFDAVFNHTGRDFFAFQDIQRNRESSAYRDWYCGVNFWGNNSYNDGFSYQNWGGYDLLVKLNQQNPAVQDYIAEVIRFWVEEFDVDGLRLDAADVLDFGFMQRLRAVANEVKPEFWLMGEVIHGEYTRWVNGSTLHSVTNYPLHKALFSGHNEHNYFEIAHTIRRLNQMGCGSLYNFVDNHDVERIASKLKNRAHLLPVYLMLYALPGVPSLYYGSEFGIEGKKERWSDDSLRPALNLADFADALTGNPLTRLIAALGRMRLTTPALTYGGYEELTLTTRQFAFARELDGYKVLVGLNNDEGEAWFDLPACSAPAYRGVVSGQVVPVQGGRLAFAVPANSGEIWLPVWDETTPAEPEALFAPVTTPVPKKEAPKQEEPKQEAKAVDAEVQSLWDAFEETNAPAPAPEAAPAAEKPALDLTKPLEQMEVAELQAVILGKMAANGPVSDRMRRDVEENIWRDSLLNWAKSFR